MKKVYLFIYSDNFGSRDDVKDYISQSPYIDTWRYDISNSFYLISEYDARTLTEHFLKFSNEKPFIFKYKPLKLLIVEIAESPLYEIDLQLKKAFKNIEIVPILADIKNKEEMVTIFNDFSPDITIDNPPISVVADALAVIDCPTEGVIDNVIIVDSGSF